MRTGLERRHRTASLAVKCVLEHQRRDPQFLRFEALEDLLRVVAAVVIADTGVIAPHDEMRASVVAPCDRMQYRLARAAVAHVRREHADHRAILRVVRVEQHLVGLHPDRGGHVVTLGLSYQRMDHQTVADFERGLLYILVRAMSRIASLEGDDFFPSALAKRRTRLSWLTRKFQERAPRYFFDQRDSSREAIRRHRGDVLRPRMRVLRRSENVLSFQLAIDFVDFRELEDGQPLAVFGRERDLSPGLERFRGRLVDAE